MLITQEQMERLFKDEDVTHYEPIRGWEHTQFGLRCGFKMDKPYAMQLAPGRRATCRARITQLSHGDSHWRMTLKIDRVVEDTPRFLQRSGGKPRGRDETDPVARGYTHMPAKALRDAGEAIDDETLTRYSKEAGERHDVFQTALEDVPIAQQLAYELERAANLGVDSVHSRMAIMRRIRQLRRKNDQWNVA